MNPRTNAAVIPIQPPTARRAVLEVKCQPGQRSVHHLLLMVPAFTQLHADDRALSQRLAVASAELFENALRADEQRSCWLRVEIGAARVRVELSYVAGASEGDAVVKLVEQVSRGAPMEAYTQALLKGGGENRSQLALARIRYEGQFELSARRDGAELVIAAEGEP